PILLLAYALLYRAWQRERQAARAAEQRADLEAARANKRRDALEGEIYRQALIDVAEAQQFEALEAQRLMERERAA
ncbi:hypothetical protein, partial [Staphylococcus aureus]